jgi:hypothetical protein
MTIQRAICAIAMLATMGLYANSAEAASYGNCYWDGSSPFCQGQCRSGFVVRKTKSCMSGYKVYCCERMGSKSQY